MQDLVYIPHTVRRTYDLDFPPVRPRDEAYLAGLLGALADARDRGLIDGDEASYQAHVAIGTDDIDEAMRRLGEQRARAAKDVVAAEGEERERVGEGDASG